MKKGPITYVVWVVVVLLAYVGMNAYSEHSVKQADALGCGIETCYGGFRSFTLICTCSNGNPDALIFLVDYSGGGQQVLKLAYTAGQATLYLKYNVFTSQYMLGSWSRSGTTCSTGYSPYCADITADGDLGSTPGSGTS